MTGFTASLTGARRASTAVLAVAVIAVLILIPSAAHASGCTISWTAKASGSWFTAANWSTNKVPGSEDEVCITENGTASYSVEMKGASVSVKTLTIGGSANTQTLVVGSSSTANALLTTTAGIATDAHGAIVMTNGDTAGNNVTLGGTISNGGTLSAEPAAGGARTIQGNLTNTGTLAINTATAFNGETKLLTNEGVLNIATGKQLSVSNKSSFTNGPGGKIVAAGTGELFEKEGTFTQGAGTTSGNVFVDDATLSYTGSGSSSIRLRGTSALAGNIAAGQTLSIESSSNENATAVATAGFTNAGAIVMTNGDTAGNNATLVVAPGILTNSGSLTAVDPVGGQRTIEGNIKNTGTMAIETNTTYDREGSVLSNEGAVNVASGKQLLVSNKASFTDGPGGKIVAAGSGELFEKEGTFTQGAGTTSGNVFVDDATLSYTGSGSSSIRLRGTSALAGNIAAGQTLSIESSSNENATVTAAKGFTNAGAIVMTNGDTAGNNATLIVSSEVLANSGSLKTVDPVGGQRTIEGNIKNTGTMAIETNTTYDREGSVLSNEGAVNIATGTQLLISNKASFTDGPGGKIVAAGTGDLFEAGGTFTEGAGTTSGNVFVDDATLSYTGSGSSSIRLRGASALAGNIAAGQTLSIESSSNEHATATATGGFTNAGAIVLTNGDGAGNNATLVIAGGTLTNGGSLTTVDPVGGQRTIQGNVTNTGTLAIETNTSDNGEATTLTNQGTINIAAGKALIVSNKSTVTNAAGVIAATGTGALVEVEGAFNEGLGKTTTSKTSNPVILDRVALHYTGIGASKIEQQGASSLSGTVGRGQTLSIESSCTEHATTAAAGTFVNSGKIVLSNSDSCANNATLSLAGGTLENKGTLEVLWPHGGVRQIEGSVINEKVLTLGNESGQPFKVSGSFVQTAKGQMSDTIAGASNFGRLAASGAVTVGGKLALKQSKFKGAPGETFGIIAGSSRTGEFASVSGNAIKSTTLHYIPHYTATGVNLVVE